MQTVQKSRGPPCVYRHMQEDHIRKLKILQSMSDFGGLWKQQKATQHALKVSVFRMSKLDTIEKKKNAEAGHHTKK